MSDMATDRLRALFQIGVPIGLLMLSCAVLAGCGGRCSSIASLDTPDRPPVEYLDEVVYNDRPLAVLGDTQRTSWQECFLRGRRINDREQEALMRSLAAEQAGALVIVGDMVYQASDPQHWTFFDMLMDPIREKNIPVLALMGNHEYYGGNRDARFLVNQHFPRLKSNEYYGEQYGRLGLVFLNSNREELDDGVWADQLQWYRKRLGELDGDEKIHGVIVFLHHPPFTLSEVAKKDRKLAEDFVEDFSAARKTLAMVSGHAHGYECTCRSGKYFIITAGGGGPLQKREGTALCLDCDATRPTSSGESDSSDFFNYLLIGQDDEGIRIEVKGLAEGESSVGQLALMEIPFAGNPK
jgi:Icc-related predicted phosphoesterase